MVFQKESLSQNKPLVALDLALQALREVDNADALIHITLEYLKTEFHYALVWLGLYNPAAHELLGKGGSCASGDAGFFKRRFVVQPGDLLEQVVVQCRPLGVPSLQEEARANEWRTAAQRFNIQGALIFPIPYRKTALGAVILGSALWGTSPHADEKARLSIFLGELGRSLALLEADQQRRQVKRSDEALLNLLPKLRSLPNLKRRLEAVIDETHRFVVPHRTHVYWYEPERRYFWKRMGNREAGFTTGTGKPTVEIPVQEINSFYHALAADQLVIVGEAEGSLRADLTGRLMQHIQSRSLVAAPIIFQGELLGFLAAEGNQARLWTEEEKNLVRGAAQLVALTAPLEEMEETIQQVKLDQSLTAEVSRALYSEEDWKASLKKCTEQLYQRLSTERLLVLLYDKDLNKFEICYQNPPTGKRKALPSLLETLIPVDWQMLERSTEAIAIENLSEDLKFMAWRKVFLEFGMKSLMVCPTALGKSLEALVIVGHEATRSWNHIEKDLLRTVSQQIGLLIHQLQLQRQTDQLQKNYQAIQWGLTTLQQTQNLERLEQSATQQIAQLLQAPLVTLITWQPGQTHAEISAPVIKHQQQFGLTVDLLIPIQTDPLVQAVLQADGLIALTAAEIAIETRYWLHGSAIGHVLAIALRTTPDHEPTGILLLGDRIDRTWANQQFNVLSILASQLAWCRRDLMLTQSLLAQKTMLEQLNWYKQRRLEEVYRILGMGVHRLNEFTNQQDAVTNLRYPQILRYLGSTLSAMTPLLKHEQWQFHENFETIPLASLLKRAMERVDAIVKQRQLWFQVHNEANLNLVGDITKIEFVLHEILVVACTHSSPGGRLDIWCRETDHHFLDLSVTDHGSLDPQLLADFQAGRSPDLLAPSRLDQPPGLHLAICRSLMQRIGGELSLYKLEDNRVMSSLQIPIISNVPTVKQSG